MRALGAAFIAKGLYADGVDALKTAIRLDPNNIWAHLFLGTGYAKLGNKEAAFQEYKVLTTLDAYKAELLRKELQSIFGRH